MRQLQTQKSKINTMFSQILGLNTNKCNGCSEHCILDAEEHHRKKGRFIPTIKGSPRGYYYDKNNIRHNIRPYADKHSAIDLARLIARLCPKYRVQYSTVTTTEPNQCTGCTAKCKISAIETEQGFMPTLENKVIDTYINAYGTTDTVTSKPKQEFAQELAERIVKRCDFYKKNIKKATRPTK